MNCFVILFLFSCMQRTTKSAPRFERIIAGDTTFHLCPIVVDNCWGFADSSQKIKIPPRFDGAYRFTNSLALVWDNHRCGFIDASGKIIIPLRYDGGLAFFENRAVVRRNGKCGYIDTMGKAVTDLSFDDCLY